MKILHTGDWHLGTFKSPTKDGVNLRFMDTVKCLEEMVRTAKEEKCDYVIVSGDIFHVGLLWSNRCCDEIVTAARFIKELASIVKHVIVMRGTPNHDGMGQFNVLSDMFELYRNVHIVTEPKMLFFEDVMIAIIPGFDAGYFRAKFPDISKEEENEVFTKELANLVIGMKAKCSQSETDRKCILLAHYTVPGADMESGQTTFLTKFEPVIPREALETAAYDLAALGHIHRPQEISGLKNCFYSGGINAFNFNDEGQERGFWIHSLDEGISSRFYETPYREFITLNLNDEDITAINSGCIDLVAENSWRYSGCVRDKIVRVLYSCTAENAKAFNGTVLKDILMADGAFMVSDILPENTEETVNREELESTSDPEENLRRYLEEKKLSEEKIQELILKARPIISRAEATGRKGSSAGFFEPIEIEVKNYRNYVHEKFSFEDISFCTINGQNGAGKSSLFMDAIIDCIYEEPREGKLNVNDKPAWLRNSQDVKSGFIAFTFRMGEKTYRIVRTREKSGTGKLNISELIDNEWKNRSAAKVTETQKIILDIVGMDSFTLKSCALIMQDQYGIFLQAKPEERIEVLGNLLGLEMYKEMKKTATETVKVYKDKADEADREININSAAIARLGNADEELERETAQLKSYESLIKSKTSERDKYKLKLTYQKEAAERRKKLLDNINILKLKKSETEQSIIVQQDIVESSDILLSEKEEIEKNVAEYNSLIEKQEALAKKSALYSAKRTEAEGLAETADIQE